MDLSKYHAILFDLDGTLVETWRVQPLPGRAERIASLRAQGLHVAIATNQAGPVWKWATGQGKYPTPAKIAENIRTICGALRLEDIHWFVSIGDLRTRDITSEEDYQTALQTIQQEFEDNINADLVHVSGLANWRKPEPGMLLAAIAQFEVKLQDCLYVGDRDEDRQAAGTASMPFMWAHDFFERSITADTSLDDLDHPF